MPLDIPNYDLLHRVGAGGFGEVWLARERVTGVLRALKIVSTDNPRLAGLEIEGVKRYQHCSHQHPGLVQILTVGQSAGAYYYVMELADAATDAPSEPYQPETLRTVMRRRSRFAAREALETVGQLARAVHRLHEEGITHNDIKPENILIIKTEPKIADMGLATGYDAQTTAGTAAYMRMGSRPDDLFALGKVLYEMISGRPADDYPLLPVELSHAPSRHLTASIKIINRACSPDMDAAFPSAFELCRSIEAAAAGPSGLRGRWSDLPARRKAAAILAVLVILTAGTIGLNHLTTGSTPRVLSARRLSGMPAFVAPPLDSRNTPYSCVHIGEEKLPTPGRWKYALDEPVKNYAMDARIRCVRPWGSLSLELSPTEEDQPGLRAKLTGQPDGMGVRVDLTSSPGDVEDPNPIRGHPQSGLEYWLRLVRCVSGPRLVVKPLCAAACEPMVLSLPPTCDLALVKTLLIESGASLDPLARFDILDLEIKSFSLPLEDPAQSAPEYAHRLQPTVQPGTRASIPQWPPGNLLSGPTHPLTASLSGLPLWTSLGNWYWFTFDVDSKECRIECAPFAVSERQTVNDLTLLEGRQLLRFEGARYSDFQARVRIRIQDPPKSEERRPYVVSGHSGSVGLAFHLQDQPPPGAELGGGYFATISTIPEGQYASASIASIPGLARRGANLVKLEIADVSRELKALDRIPQTEEILRKKGFELTVCARGDRLTMQLNGRFLLECTDDQFTNGRVALYTSRLIASFDSLEISPLPAEGNR